MNAKRILYRLVVLTAALLPLTAARAQPSLEYQVKAAYLTKFAPFVQWPDGVFASPTAPVSICILGADPFGPIIDKAAAAARDGRPLTVRRISAASAAAGCHILFAEDGKALTSLAGKPVVTVSDSDAPEHGVISFVLTDNHVRFDIDDAAAARSGLRISSKLLELAHAVVRRSGP
jgi:uncharacterized protein DUF4154